MKATDLLVRCLETEGVETIFGVPGEENADFMLSLERSERIRFVLTRHEQGAAFMAEAYGRLTGDPGVCLGTLGPGATNLITGVADANMDRAPMLVITGQADSDRLHKESHQAMDVVSMFRPVTKWSWSIRLADNIPEVVRKAVRLARAEKPGACHIELPEDVAKADATTQPLEPRRFHRPAPEQRTVDRAVEILRRARRPVILAGNGCIRKRASYRLRSLCDRTGISVISTFMAKGCVDVDADYALFTVGLQARDRIWRTMNQADVVVAAGYDMVEYSPQLWNPDRDKCILHVDFMPAEIDAYYHPDVELVGDVANALAMLSSRIEAAGGLRLDRGLQQAVRADMLTDFAEFSDDDTSGSVRPQKVLWDVREALRPHDILISDVGAHKLWIARNYHCHEPNTCLIPNGFCSMGFALPAAIAAGLVYPERRILAICGDGGFLMNVQEMETARRLESEIAVMVWEDGGFGMISWKQETEFGCHTDLSFGNPDFLKLADSFGWNGFRCDKSGELRAVLDAAFSQPGPSLIVVPIDYRENARLSRRLGDLARHPI